MDIPQIRMIEELAANAWRPKIEQHLGGWRLRYTGGKSRRVNSVWPNGLPALNSIHKSLEIAEEFYLRRSSPPCFQLCPAALPTELPQLLAERGYTFYAQTAVQVQPTAQLLSHTSQSEARVTASPDLTDDWFELYTSASGYEPESLPIVRGILTRIGPAARFTWLEWDGKPAAAGLGIVERGWLGVFCVVTSPPLRRKGFSTAVMHALAQWGLEQGAGGVYLQVMDDNLPALNLYSRLGFAQLYQYYYAVKDKQDE